MRACGAGMCLGLAGGIEPMHVTLPVIERRGPFLLLCQPVTTHACRCRRLMRRLATRTAPKPSAMRRRPSLHGRRCRTLPYSYSRHR